MKNKILVMVLVMLMVFSSAAAAFADSGIQPYDTDHVIFSIHRTSGTTAEVELIVSFSSIADEYSVVVYLQKLVNGTWKNDTTNPDYVYFNNGANSSSCPIAKNYNSLTYGVSYRLMVVSRDIHGSNEYRATTYSNLF